MRFDEDDKLMNWQHIFKTETERLTLGCWVDVVGFKRGDVDWMRGDLFQVKAEYKLVKCFLIRASSVPTLEMKTLIPQHDKHTVKHQVSKSTLHCRPLLVAFYMTNT